MKKINLKLLHPRANVPKKHSVGASGYDLSYSGKDCVILNKGDTKTISTGIALEMPLGMEAQIRSRSGLATKGLYVLNSPGTIDSDYRGELHVVLHNVGEDTIIFPDTRIAQLVFSKVENVDMQMKGRLAKTKRGTKGLGSTGR